MTENTNEMGLTELESLEFSRRKDIASAVLKAAVRQFNMRDELREAIGVSNKETNNIWIAIAFFGGLILDYFMSTGSGLRFNFGLWLTGMAILYWYMKKYDHNKLKLREVDINEKLYDLEVTWNSALSNGTFWSIDKIKKGYEGDEGDEKFINWWAEQKTAILINVCGYEKGNEIGDGWARRDAIIQKSLRENFES